MGIGVVDPQPFMDESEDLETECSELEQHKGLGLRNTPWCQPLSFNSRDGNTTQ